MKVLVFGDSMTDEYIYGEVNRTSPEEPSAPVIDVVDDSGDIRLGGCLNVALNLKALGLDVYVSSIMSTFEMNWLAQYAISAKYSSRGEPLRKERFINSATGKQIVRIDDRKTYSYLEIGEYHDQLRNRVFSEQFDAIVVSDYMKGVIDSELPDFISSFNVPVFVDTKNPNLAIWNNNKRVVFKLNKKESSAANCSDVSPNHSLVTTLGADGCQIQEKVSADPLTYTRFFVTKHIPEADTVGAGDVFLSAFVSRYLTASRTVDVERYRLEAAAHFANAMAGISCTKRGTYVLTKKDIESYETL